VEYYQYIPILPILPKKSQPTILPNWDLGFGSIPWGLVVLGFGSIKNRNRIILGILPLHSSK
jgi:hypothetical protein